MGTTKFLNKLLLEKRSKRYSKTQKILQPAVKKAAKLIRKS